MSYRSQPIPPARHRSSSSVRSAPSTYNRPRSLGFYSSNSNPYSSPYQSPSNPYSSPLGNYSNYSSSNYKSPYFQNGYRANPTTGYASLSLPSKTLAKLSKLSPNFSKSFEAGSSRDNARSSRRDTAPLSGSLRESRDRSSSRSRSSLPSSSGMGSKSLSLTSLNSEGYASGNERSTRSRLGSSADIRNENGEIDYKKLYEEAMIENERLKDKLRKTEEELRDTKQTLEKINVVTSKNSISELEKREKRAMERKLSEMEEELKQLQKLKSENERLKADNKSLTRVVNKFTGSAKK